MPDCRPIHNQYQHCILCCVPLHNNNNNNNNRIYLAPYGRNYRGAGRRSEHCSVKAWENKTSFKSRFAKNGQSSLMRTVCGSEFQTDGGENRKTRLEKSVLINGWTSSGIEDERKARLQTRSAWLVVQVNRSGCAMYNFVRQNYSTVWRRTTKFGMWGEVYF